MAWRIGLIIAIILLGGIIGYSIFLLTYKKKIKYPVVPYLLMTFFGGVAVFFPIYWSSFDEDAVKLLETIILSLHNSIRLFVLDGDFEIIFSADGALTAIDGWFRNLYHVITAVFYIIAPILTAGFVLSLLKNARAIIKFRHSTNKEVYVFSELNKKTINLAKSIRAKNKKSVIVFCDITDKIKEDNNEIFEDLLDIKAIAFERDISSLNFKRHTKKGVFFFIISEDDEKNLVQYSSLLEKNSDMENGKIFLFSRSAQSELMFNNVTEHKISCRKYNADFLIIYNYLFEKGVDIFSSAKGEDGNKKISVTVIGLGLNGKTLVKALAWYCQMDGYELEINAFDSDPNAESKFAAEAPELLNPAFAHPSDPKENQYIINIHGGVDVETKEFLDEINKIGKEASFAFCCLGDDERNIDTAMKLRMIFARNDNNPHIVAIVYNGKKDYVVNATNFKGQKYDIECIGSYEESYTYEFIVDSKLETEALKAHARYCKQNSELQAFFAYSYNFRSNCATVIHKEARKALNIHGSASKSNELTQEQIDAIEVLEHRRWSAWIRSEGYSYNPTRNDLAKYHHDIRLFDELDADTRRKDSVVGIEDEEDKQ